MPEQLCRQQGQSEARFGSPRSLALPASALTSGAPAYLFLLPSLVFLAVFTL